MLEAQSTSETSVNFYQTTQRNIPEDCHLPTRRCENLKYQLMLLACSKVDPNIEKIFD
jgi:hypothetical protein